MILPIYNPHDETWLIDNEDGTFSTVSNEVYQEMYSPYRDMFVTRYDKLGDDDA